VGLFGSDFLPFDGLVGVILNLAFVLDDLAIDFVGQKVDGSVQVFIGGFAVDVFAAQMHGDFGGVLEALDREYDLCVYDVIEMPRGSRHFVFDIRVYCRGNFQMTTTNAQVHMLLSYKK